MMVRNTPSSVYTPILNYDGKRYTDGAGYNLKLMGESEAENHTLGKLEHPCKVIGLSSLLLQIQRYFNG